MADCNITPDIWNLGTRSGQWLASRYFRLNPRTTALDNYWIDESGGAQIRRGRFGEEIVKNLVINMEKVLRCLLGLMDSVI